MYRTYPVRRREREPLMAWMVEALQRSGCRILHVSDSDRAPFRLTFETEMGERLGVVAYAFRANSKLTKNRPADEHRFQIKYGPDDKEMHRIWQDPFELYTTLFVGINLEGGFFVGADPVVHNPTRFFISLEFKEQQVEAVREKGWHSWERTKRDARQNEYPVEILVGGSQEHFLRFVRFERAARGLDAGHRQLLAEKLGEEPSLLSTPLAIRVREALRAPVPHAMAEEFQLSQDQILDLIGSAPRLKMAVRGWVAEVHLQSLLEGIRGVEDCVRIEEEGGADIRLRYCGSRPLEIECKNVLRQRLADGTIRLDFQRTRAAKRDPCSRFYSAKDFDLVAACLHSCTETWEFRYAATRSLDPHRSCRGKLHHGVRLDQRWTQDVERILREVAETR